MSVFGVILVRIFPHSDWIWRDTKQKRSSTTYWIWFFKKKVSHDIFFQLTKFNCVKLLLFEILSNMCIAIVCLPGCDGKNFEINLAFLIKPSFCTIKSQDRNLNILRTKGERGFIIFKGLSVTKNCFRPESAALKWIFKLVLKKANIF